MTAPAGMTAPRAGRRELLSAVLGALAGAGAVLLSVGRPWVRVAAGPSALAPATDLLVSGRTVEPAVGALGLVALAASVAIVATRRFGRALTGLVVVLTGLAIAALTVGVTRDPKGAAAATEAVRRAGPDGAFTVTGWPWVAVAGATGIALAGGVVVAWGRRWPAMSARYDAPEPGRREAVAPEVAMWEALDRGDDPT